MATDLHAGIDRMVNRFSLEALHRQVKRCAELGPPSKLCQLDYPALELGETSPPRVLSHRWAHVVVRTMCSHQLGRFLWLQTGYHVRAPLLEATMWVTVPRGAYLCVNRWRPSDFVDKLEPGSVELYGWVLKR